MSSKQSDTLIILYTCRKNQKKAKACFTTWGKIILIASGLLFGRKNLTRKDLRAMTLRGSKYGMKKPLNPGTDKIYLSPKKVKSQETKIE